MITKNESLRRYLFVVGVPFLIIFSMWILSKSTWFSNYPKELSLGITLDLILTMPFLHFLIIRKKKIPKLTIVSVFVIGILSASFILPENHQSLLNSVKSYFLPLLELSIFSLLAYKGVQVYRKFKSEKKSNLDFYDAIKIASNNVFPNKISGFLATEIAVIYYAFFSWREKALKENEFSNYKENGIKTILYALILIIFIETFAIHSYLEKWSFVTAWILSFLSVYTAIQILALIKSLSKRPIYIDEIHQKVVLRFGFFGFAEIPFLEINRLELHNKDLPEDKSIIAFSPLGTLGGHNIILHLNNQIQIEGFYGIKKQADKLAIFIDDKKNFIDLIEKHQ